MAKNSAIPRDGAAAKTSRNAAVDAASADAVADARLNLVRSKAIKASLPVGNAQPSEHIRILIVEDHPLVREGLRALLTLQPEFRVVGEAADGDEALRLAAELEPDVMLLDFSMPKKSGLEVMRELHDRSPRTQTILVTAGVEKPDIVTLFRHGARGVVLKSAPSELLFKCIRKVHAGEVWIGREAMAGVLEVFAKSGDEAARQRDFGLTPRERQIVRLIVEGETNKGISQRLSIGQDTVKHHLTSSFDKTGTSSRLELALFALDHHLV